MAAPALLRAPVLVVPRRVNAVVRALVEDVASPVTAADGTVVGWVRQEPPARAPIARALFLAVSIAVNSPGTGRDPTFAVQDADGSPLLRLAFGAGMVRVQDATQTEIGVLANEARSSGPDIVVRVYGPARTSRWSPRSLRHLRGEPLAEGSAPYAQAPELTLVDAAGSAVARTARVDERVRTEILTESLPLRTLLAGLACSMVMPEWVDRPSPPPRG
jgi:hypothetical protein